MKKHIYVSLAIGFLVGLLCKLVDFIPGNTLIGYLGIKDLFNYLGLFVIITSLIEYTAPTIKCGIFQTLGFMALFIHPRIASCAVTVFVHLYIFSPSPVFLKEDGTAVL